MNLPRKALWRWGVLVAAILPPLLVIFWRIRESTVTKNRTRETMRRMTTICAGMTYYAEDHSDRFPVPCEPSASFEGLYDDFPHARPPMWPVGLNRQATWLLPHLSPTYVKHLPVQDGWGGLIFVDVSADGCNSTILSLGSDHHPDAGFPSHGWKLGDGSHDLILLCKPEGMNLGAFISSPEDWAPYPPGYE